MRGPAGAKCLACVMGVVMSACAFTNTKVVDDVLVDTPRGSVFLQKAEDGWFRTAHPFDLSSEVLATVFRGVHVQASPTDRTTEERVFSNDDTQFLSTLISVALSKAIKSQVVGFRVVHDLDGRQETTGGILYVQGRLLHLTLTHFRARYDLSEPGGTSHRLNPNPTGLEKQQIRFSPEAARRSSRNEQPDVIALPQLVSLVLDYEALIEGAALPPTSVRSRPLRRDKPSVIQQIVEPMFPTSGAPVSHDRHAVSDDASRTVQPPVPEEAGELEALKEEVRKLQRQLSDLEGNTKRTKLP
jgi:hypothetical protein